MNKNLNIINKTMTEFSDRLHHSECVLKYSLYLHKALYPNMKQISKDNIADCINKIADDVWYDYNTFVNGGELHFFGYKGSDNSPQEEDLAFLGTSAAFWMHALKQNAVMSTFDKLRKVIGESYILSASERVQISNYTLREEETHYFDKYHHGFDFLTMETSTKSLPYLHLTTTENNSAPTISNSTRYPNMPKGNRDLYNSNAQNHKRRIEILTRKLTEAGLSISPLYLSPSVDSNTQPDTLFSLLEFFNFTVARRSENSSGTSSIQPILDAHKIGKNFSPAQYDKYITSVNHLLASIAAKDIDKDSITYDSDSSSTSCKLNLSDKIYLRYQIEKVFAPSTINCLYQNTVATKGKIYALHEQNNINLLASCLRLPNVFTRQYILQMAIDTIAKHYDYSVHDSDFFTKKLKSPALIMNNSVSKYNYLNEFNKMDIWIKRYRNTMNYLNHILFPVHENYFFCALWNAVKNTHSHYTDAQIAVEMYKLLQLYLNNPENVEKLFATDNVIINSPTISGRFNPDNIIHPSFKSGKKVDTTLYKHCLIAHTLTYKDELIPDFISLSYLDKIADKPHRQIQDLYILESASFKR